MLGFHIYLLFHSLFGFLDLLPSTSSSSQLVASDTWLSRDDGSSGKNYLRGKGITPTGRVNKEISKQTNISIYGYIELVTFQVR